MGNASALFSPKSAYLRSSEIAQR